MKVGDRQWTRKIKRKWHSKFNSRIKRNIYALITRHPQVVQSPISNYCLKVMFDDQTEPQIVPRLLRLLSDTIGGGLKDARD